ncbi:MAG: transposase family protein [Cytophagales bacterium]|nr:MAG: transposase family protein [Cytophagales bacterium]
MNDKYAALKENPKYCKRLFGINYENFKTILEKVQKHEVDFLAQNPLSCRGIEGNFSLENQLLLALEYLRQYPTFLSLGFSYGISESYANKVYHKIRIILAEVIGLKNPEKLKYKDVKTLIVDVTVQAVERPLKGQEKQYNGVKKSTLLKHN